jgi:hypothetical protein
MGLSDQAIYYITHEGAYGMQWLTAEDAAKIGISTEVLDFVPCADDMGCPRTRVTRGR